MTGRAALARNAVAYAGLLALRAGLGRSHPRAVTALTRFTAEFCEFNHPGRFADGALENPLLDLGRDVKPEPVLPAGPFPGVSRRRVLHVTTQATGIGGHTRTIRHWIESDPASSHSLVVTAQGRAPLPAWVRAAVAASGGTCDAFPFPACPLARAGRLRAGTQSVDLVVLHHYGHDPVPVLAFAGSGPPVALLNHADHMFWMGGTVADLVVHQRDIGRTLNDRRHTHRDVVLPVPLAEPARCPRPDARARLGIPADQVVLLSVGRACKYVPTPTHNFFRAAHRILTAHPAAHVYLLGVAEPDLADHYAAYRHDRFHFLGARDGATDYQQAADVYLEGFPFGSQTALLEAALVGAPVVPAFAPPLRLLATSDESLVGLATTPASEDEYVERAGTFVGSRDLREATGSALITATRAAHVGDGWKRRLAAVYAITDTLTHRPGPLPVTADEALTDDVALAEWQAGRPGGVGAVTAARAVHDVARQAAYSLRKIGARRAAFAVLRRAVRHGGPSRHLLADLAKTLGHRVLTAAAHE